MKLPSFHSPSYAVALVLSVHSRRTSISAPLTSFLRRQSCWFGKTLNNVLGWGWGRKGCRVVLSELDQSRCSFDKM
ncbi:hypothetical protein GE21DRAFT_1002834 [Neurospora crassa]|nr:hypothetical protein GE21DRAFT_1002834 [Neurospora crassa]